MWLEMRKVVLYAEHFDVKPYCSGKVGELSALLFLLEVVIWNRSVHCGVGSVSKQCHKWAWVGG